MPLIMFCSCCHCMSYFKVDFFVCWQEIILLPEIKNNNNSLITKQDYFGSHMDFFCFPHLNPSHSCTVLLFSLKLKLNVWKCDVPLLLVCHLDCVGGQVRIGHTPAQICHIWSQCKIRHVKSQMLLWQARVASKSGERKSKSVRV